MRKLTRTEANFENLIEAAILIEGRCTAAMGGCRCGRCSECDENNESSGEADSFADLISSAKESSRSGINAGASMRGYRGRGRGLVKAKRRRGEENEDSIAQSQSPLDAAINVASAAVNNPLAKAIPAVRGLLPLADRVIRTAGDALKKATLNR